MFWKSSAATKESPADSQGAAASQIDDAHSLQNGATGPSQTAVASRDVASGHAGSNGHDGTAAKTGQSASKSTVIPRQEPASLTPEQKQERQFQALKSEVHRQVINKIDLSLVGAMDDSDLRFEIRRATEQVLRGRPDRDQLSPQDHERLLKDVIDETFGLGPLEPLFLDPEITDVMINGPDTVYVERNGRLELTPIRFANDAHLLRIVQRIVSAIGRRIDETTPMVDARLADGSRVNAIIPPLAIDGTTVSIRRFPAEPLEADHLLAYQSITPEMLQFLAACIQARMNVLISGGTGSGKTTLMSVLSSYIGHDERLATIEDAAELRLLQPHVVRMETRPPNIEGSGEVTTRDLVRNSLRMRPDRIIVGECRGAEALDMLQAMNTGHDGSLTTVHANSPRDAISRLEMMVGMAGLDVPIWTIRRQIASAIDIIVQLSRLTGGARKVTRIAEVTGMEGEILTMHDLFEFRQTGLDEQRRAQGFYAATGVRPNCLEQFESAGVPLSVQMFEERILSGTDPKSKLQ